MTQFNQVHEAFSIRLANADDIPALEILIPLSVRSLQSPYYSTTQMEASLGIVFGVDRQLINDGTYFVVEHSGRIVGSGGWSRRPAEFGGDSGRPVESAPLSPAHDPARIRAFYVHPNFARRGIARLILSACESALCAAGFHEVILVATLAGEPLYVASGYSPGERYDIPLPHNIGLPVVRMSKKFSRAEQPLQTRITFSTVTAADFDELAALRIAAMRESLERAGRFDPERARERLRKSFYPEHTKVILFDDQRIGFYTFRPTDDGFQLDHLYIHPSHQSQGIGSYVMSYLLSISDDRKMPVHLGALRDSSSNRFYQRHGFVQTSEDEWDIYYVRAPKFSI